MNKRNIDPKTPLHELIPEYPALQRWWEKALNAGAGSWLQATNSHEAVKAWLDGEDPVAWGRARLRDERRSAEVWEAKWRAAGKPRVYGDYIDNVQESSSRAPLIVGGATVGLSVLLGFYFWSGRG